MTRPDSVDYSFGRPTSPATLAAQGIKLVMRYLSPPPNGKNLTAPEAQALLGAGLAILLGWETNSTRALAGRVGGRMDGKGASDLAQSLGAPHGLTIYYAVDFDTNPGEYPVIADYFRGVGEDKRYQVGIYGEADVIEAMHKLGVVTSEWQTYAWSHGRLSPEADLYQYLNGQNMAGVTVDFDRIIHVDKLGAWWPSGLVPASGGSTQLQSGGFMSGLTDARQADLAAKIDLLVYGMNNSILPTLAGLRPRLDAIAAKVNAPVAGGGVDEAALAADIAANLKAALPAAIVAEIAKELAS